MERGGGEKRDQEKEIGQADASDDSEIERKIEKLYRASRSLDYYGILNVGKDATVEEIRRAYHRMAKEFHPDKYIHLESDSLKEKLQAVFSYINEAYRELTSSGKTRGSLPPQRETAASREQNRDLAKMRFNEGKRCFSSGQYEDAATFLGQAIYLDDTVAQYHYYYGIALLRKNQIKPAEEALKKASKLDPDNSVYIAELGHIYLRLGFMTRARSAFERALRCNPADRRAREGIEKLTS